MKITLKSTEMGAGLRVGGLRHYHAVIRKCRQKSGTPPEEGWSHHIEGALGEMAAAKALNMYWPGSVNAWKECDLYGIQVRTRSKSSYDLIVRPDDAENCVWVLVTGSCGSYEVCGWISGFDAKQERFFGTPNNREPAYFIPKSELKPIETLTHKDIEEIRNQKRRDRQLTFIQISQRSNSARVEEDKP